MPPGLEPADGMEASAGLESVARVGWGGWGAGPGSPGSVGLPSETFLRLKGEIGLCAFRPTRNKVSAQWPSVVPKRES